MATATYQDNGLAVYSDKGGIVNPPNGMVVEKHTKTKKKKKKSHSTMKKISSVISKLIHNDEGLAAKSNGLGIRG